MWNFEKIRKIEDLLQFNLIKHKLKNKKILFKEEIFLITNVFKEWNCGWYISLEIECISNSKNYNEFYLKIPFLNLNSDNKLIQKRIEIFNEQLKFL